MNPWEQFLDSARIIAKKFQNIPKEKTIKVITHYDCDGICSGAILIHALKKEGFNYSLKVVQQITEKVMADLSLEDYGIFVFTDLGSSQLTMISKYLAGSMVFILDHHIVEESDCQNINHLNPHLFGIDGSCEIAGAGVTYFFCSMLNQGCDEIAHIAVIGAIGDVQEKNGFAGINSNILEIAVRAGNIALENGLRLFGYQTRPLHKCLEYSTDPLIPNVSGNECAAIQFLQQIGISPRKENDWVRLTDLTECQRQKLTEAIIVARAMEEHPTDIFAQNYILCKEKQNTPFRDAKEFSTLINSCGRLNRAELGVLVCLGDDKAKEEATLNLVEYKKEIVNAMNWLSQNSSSVERNDGFIIINAKDNIKSAMIGTLASMLSKSQDLPPNTYIMSLARTEEGMTKISLRISGYENGADLKQIMENIIRVTGGTTGGHQRAAGAIIQTDCEEAFVSVAKNTLAQIVSVNVAKKQAC